MNLESFSENFELLTDAPNAVVKLRKIILQLAVRGKLVSQDTNDEPASVLLEKVTTKIEQLVKAGKIRSGEVLYQDIDTKTKLPNGWVWTKIGYFTILISGQHLGQDEQNDKVEGIPYLTGPADFGEINPKATRWTTTIKAIAEKNDILITVKGAGVGKSNILGMHKAAIGRQLMAIRPIFVDFNYTYLLVLASYEKFQSLSIGSTVPGIGRRDILEFAIGLPPLAEQKRIVAKVDRLLILCDEIEKRQQQRQESIKKMNESAVAQLLSSQNPDDFRQHWQRICNNFDLLYSIPETIPKLRQAILQLAVQGKLVRQDPNDEPGSVLLEKIKAERTHLAAKGIIKKFEPLPPISDENIPFELPEGWTWARFPELGEFGRGKSKHRPRNDPKLYEDGKHPVVQTGDVARANGIITTYTGMYNDVGLAQSRLWAKGTLCITIAANIADSGILGFDACIPDSVVGFIPSKLIGDTRYFEYFMRTAKEHLQDYAPSTAQKNINLAILEKVLIPFPSLAEQKRIVAKVDRLMSLCDELEGKLKEVRSHNEKLMEVAAREVLAA